MTSDEAAARTLRAASGPELIAELRRTLPRSLAVGPDGQLWVDIEALAQPNTTQSLMLTLPTLQLLEWEPSDLTRAAPQATTGR